MPLNPPHRTDVGHRYICERCGERWHEENIDECVNCKRDVCPNCAGLQSFAGRKEREWWCDACASRYREGTV